MVLFPNEEKQMNMYHLTNDESYKYISKCKMLNNTTCLPTCPLYFAQENIFSY